MSTDLSTTIYNAARTFVATGSAVSQSNLAAYCGQAQLEGKHHDAGLLARRAIQVVRYLRIENEIDQNTEGPALVAEYLR